jgi:hypothetical protein
MCDGNPEMARTSAFFGSVMPKEFYQKRLKFSVGFAELAFGSVPGSFSLVTFFWRSKRK